MKASDVPAEIVDETTAEEPLSWHGAPEKSKKRKKVVESSEPVPELISKKRRKKRRQEEGEPDDLSTPLPKAPETLQHPGKQKMVSKSNGKKMSQAQWSSNDVSQVSSR